MVRARLCALIVLFVCGCDHAVVFKSQVMKRNLLHISVKPTPTYPAIMCKFFHDFTPEQTNFCMKHPRVAAEISKGIKMGLEQCEKQFKDHRWNCSTYHENASFGQDRAVQGTKEAAFVNAIVAAGVAHSVTSACAKGDIPGCFCAQSKEQKTSNNDWGSSGCNNNIAYGVEISKTFLSGSRDPVGKKYELQIKHNREAGRQVHHENLAVRCNCHGISGACTSKTCWETASDDLKRIGDHLKRLYDDATKVEVSYTVSREGKIPNVLILPKTVFVKPPKKKLVFLDESPIYCDPQPEKGIFGTKGRVCERSKDESKSVGSCHTLCCGRGYNKLVVNTKTKCNCTFRWCCVIKCKICNKEKEQTVCK